MGGNLWEKETKKKKGEKKLHSRNQNNFTAETCKPVEGRDNLPDM